MEGGMDAKKIKVGPEREGRKAHTSGVFPRTKERQTFVPDERQEWGQVGRPGKTSWVECSPDRP